MANVSRIQQSGIHRKPDYQTDTVVYCVMLQDAFGNTVGSEEPVRTVSHAQINDLPTEVLIQIFCNLAPTDLKDLRLVCHKWNYAVLDKTAWTKAFDNRFCTGRTFASVTRSLLWLLEYFGRVAFTKKWAKGKGSSHLYQLVNDRFSLHYIDFKHDRLLAFSRITGSVSLCTLSLGRNQVFMPEMNIFSGICTYDTNYNYLVVAFDDGRVYIKNLISATSTSSNLLSMKELHAGNEPMASLKINPHTDRNKEKGDVVGVTRGGTLRMWNLAGEVKHVLETGENALVLDTDFRTVVVVTATSVYIVDFFNAELIYSFEHGLESDPMCSFDLHDNNIVLATANCMKVFHFDENYHTSLETMAPEGVTIIDGTIQKSEVPKNLLVAGGDGLLYALTFSDGSVGVYNIRDLNGSIPMKCRIMQFQDNRTPQGIAQFTKVALNSAVIAIGALPDWVHFYDAHSGRYLREGTKVRRILTRNGTEPVLQIQLLDDTSGAVVSGDIVQYFRYGEIPVPKKKPNAPLAADTNNRRALNQHIKAEIAEYDEQEQSRLQREMLADRYNGTKFDNEQEELRMALALSASVGEESDEELKAALELLAKYAETQRDSSDELSEAIRLSQMDSEVSEGPSRLAENPGDDSDEETLRRVLQLSLAEH